MKNMKLLKSILCLVLIAAMGLVPMTAFAAKSAYILNVNTDRARLRDGSGASSHVIQTLRKGTKVLFWGVKSASFLKVATTGGKVGYVYRNYLSVYGALKKDQIYVTNQATSVYKLVGSKLKRYSSVGTGKYLLVIAQNNGWAYVRTVTGKAGYVKSSALTKAF